MTAVCRTVCSLLLLLLSFSPIAGQKGNRGPLVLELPGSTRALALGNAFALASQESDAVFYQPGRLGRAQGFGASLQRFADQGTLSTFSAGTSWFGGGVAIGIQQLSYGTHTPSGSLLVFPSDEAALRNKGDIGVSETVLSVGYGKTLWGIQMGAVGKLVEQRYGPRKAGTAAVDLGLASTAGPVTLGASVQNLGPDMTMAGTDRALPTRFILGVSTDARPVGPLDISAATALAYRLDGDVEPSVGLEFGYWPVNGRTFVGRIGYRYRSDDFTATPLTFGGAFYGDDIVLEYAWQGFEEGDPAHRFGIGWR